MSWYEWRDGWWYVLEVDTKGLRGTARRAKRRGRGALSASFRVPFGHVMRKRINRHFAEYDLRFSGKLCGFLFVRLSVSNLTDALGRAVPQTGIGVSNTLARRRSLQQLGSLPAVYL